MPRAVAQTAKLFSSLEEIAWTVNSSLDAEIVLQSIVRSVTEHSPWRICWVGLVDLVRCKFSMYAEAGFRPPLAQEGRTWPLEGSATLLAVQQGKPLCLPDALDQETFPLVRDDARHYGFRSVLIIPLRLGDAHGAMWFCAPTAGTFRHSEVAYASAIGAQATVALRNSHLFERERELRAMQIERASELERVNRLVAHQNKLLERLNASHVRLIEMVLAERGLQPLADAAAELLGNPVMIFDRSERLLACSMSAEDQHVQPGTQPSFRDRLDQLARQRRAAVVDDPSGRSLLTPVMSGRNLLGFLHIGELWRRFEEVDLTVAEQVGLLTAVELMKARIRFDAELRLKADLVEALLADDGDLRQQAALLGLDLSQPLQIVIADVALPQEPPTDSGEALVGMLSTLHDVVADRLSNYPRPTVTVLRGGRVVVVLQVHQGERDSADPGEKLAAVIKQAAGENRRLSRVSVTIGVSRPRLGSLGLQRSYKEAQKALVMAGVLRMQGSVLPFAQIGVYDLLLDDDRAEDLVEFARPRLTRLLDYDKRRGRALLPTLEVYLASGCDVVQAASQLFLHVTTVRYRLGRIRDITGLDLADAEVRLSLHLALKIYRLHGLRLDETPARQATPVP
jgi:sugar diacid utilization regulator/GAF domain-containing protein